MEYEYQDIFELAKQTINKEDFAKYEKVIQEQEDENKKRDEIMGMKTYTELIMADYTDINKVKELINMKITGTTGPITQLLIEELQERAKEYINNEKQLYKNISFDDFRTGNYTNIEIERIANMTADTYRINMPKSREKFVTNFKSDLEELKTLTNTLLQKENDLKTSINYNNSTPNK